ncbi:hypothetical protein VTJ83DRAFT_782 [Remersonia thermophila]|uniref:Rhodopsin domain-containing protein n=1 Tax=Remersonia thermophila TaxID=72144 RepID=A0ABR4DLY5_9PEZI
MRGHRVRVRRRPAAVMALNDTVVAWADPSAAYPGDSAPAGDLPYSNNGTEFNATYPYSLIPEHPSRQLQADIAACSVITFLIASIFVGLRFYTRGYVSHVLGWSDWLILPALLCSAGVTGSSLEQMVHGAGKHWWNFDPTKFLNFERAAWYGMLFYNLSLSFSRISILLLYKRIFVYDWIKRATQIVLIIVVATSIWFAISVFTVCIPLQAFWDWSLYWTTHVYCQPAHLWWVNAAFHIGSDFVIMALPMPVLAGLTLPRRQKYAIIGVFALGFFVCVISIIRLAYLIMSTKQDWWTMDGSYTSAHMIFWTTVEVNTAISCACIMTLKPLIEHVFPRLLSPDEDRRDPTLQWITPISNGSLLETEHGSGNNNSSPVKRVSSCSPTSLSFPLAPLTPTHQPPSSAHAPRRMSAPALYPVRSRAGSIGGTGLRNLPEHEHEHDALETSRYYHGFTAPTAVAGRKPSVGGHSGGGASGGDATVVARGTYDLDADLDLEAQRAFRDDCMDEKHEGFSSLTASTAVTRALSSAGGTERPFGPGDNDEDPKRSSSVSSVRSSEPGSPAVSPRGMVHGGGEDRGSLRAPPRAHFMVPCALEGLSPKGG